MIRIAVLVCVFVALAHGAAVQSVPTAAFQQVYGSYSYYRANNEHYTKYNFCLANRQTCAVQDFCLAYNTTCTGMISHTTPGNSYNYGLFLQLCGKWCRDCATSYSSCPASSTTNGSPASAPPANKCEYSRVPSFTSRISGNNGGSLQCQNPWIVAFKPQSSTAVPPTCSGIIFSSNKVLTSKECLNELTLLPSFVVTVGDHIWTTIDPSEEDLTTTYISHVDRATGLVSMTLKHNLYFDSCKAPACLEFRDSTIRVDPLSCKIVGWGLDNGNLPDALRQGAVTIKSDCADTLATFMSMPSSPLDITTEHTSTIGCTDHSGSHAAACNHDTGGPITCTEVTTGETIVVGIIKAGTCENAAMHTTFFVDLSSADSKLVLNAL